MNLLYNKSFVIAFCDKKLWFFFEEYPVVEESRQLCYMEHDKMVLNFSMDKNKSKSKKHTQALFEHCICKEKSSFVMKFLRIYISCYLFEANFKLIDDISMSP